MRSPIQFIWITQCCWRFVRFEKVLNNLQIILLFTTHTSSEIAATYCPFHTFRSPSISNVLTISSTLREVRVEISFILHVQ